jgi:hypothetical protein
MSFICSICEEESTRICVSCTKDSCENHLCEKCGKCSDCCGCGITLTVPTSARDELSRGRTPGTLDAPASEFKVAAQGSNGILNGVVHID